MHTSYQFHTSEACNTFLSDAVQDEITRLLGITIKGKGTTIRLSGAQEDVDLTSALLDRCQQNGGGLQAGEVEAELIRMRNPTVFPEILRDHRGKLIRPLTKNQNDYVESLYTNQLTFGTGPAGVGKTYLATAVAISRLLKGDVERVIITRPAVEAGEKLGFLPGDLNEKMEPYLVPLRDAMNEFVGSSECRHG